MTEKVHILSACQKAWPHILKAWSKESGVPKDDRAERRFIDRCYVEVPARCLEAADEAGQSACVVEASKIGKWIDVVDLTKPSPGQDDSPKKTITDQAREILHSWWSRHQVIHPIISDRCYSIGGDVSRKICEERNQWINDFNPQHMCEVFAYRECQLPLENPPGYISDSKTQMLEDCLSDHSESFYGRTKMYFDYLTIRLYKTACTMGWRGGGLPPLNTEKSGGVKNRNSLWSMSADIGRPIGNVTIKRGFDGVTFGDGFLAGASVSRDVVSSRIFGLEGNFHIGAALAYSNMRAKDETNKVEKLTVWGVGPQLGQRFKFETFFHRNIPLSFDVAVDVMYGGLKIDGSELLKNNLFMAGATFATGVEFPNLFSKVIPFIQANAAAHWLIRRRDTPFMPTISMNAGTRF